MIRHLRNLDNCKCIFNILVVSYTLFYIRFYNFDVKESIYILNFLATFFIVLEIIVRFGAIYIPQSGSVANLGRSAWSYNSTPLLVGRESEEQLGRKHNKLKLKISTVVQVIIQSIASVVLIHITVILFGAYPIQNFQETLTFSFLVASLVCIRPLICFGPTAILSICQDWNWSNCSQVQGSFVVIGSWLGAFLIPLDWDRPWQVWPLTCCMGALFGELTASVILLYDRSRKLKKVF